MRHTPLTRRAPAEENQIEDSILAAIIGFVGVVVGATIAGLREWLADYRRRKSAGAYAAARLACELDQFFDRACDVVRDEGLDMGQYNLDGCRETQVAPPTFEPESLDVDWKALPADLMYRVLSLPNDATHAEDRVAANFECGDGPPDFEDGYRTRRFEYAGLALSALELAGSLRTKYGLPRRMVPEWNSVDFLNRHRR